ncbi:MAG TPA: hypothetical protein DDW52_24140 [Planctomycetaceae bacterium]|nr:hypothetical protein [Planctomycetaceae bacterium]
MIVRITENGTRQWVDLPANALINVDCANWSGSRVALEYSRYGTEDSKKPLRIDEFTEAVATENTVWISRGQGFLRPVTTSYGGTEVLVSIEAVG